ncbi:MAG TPA: Gfo/Idh/MocA family oxidoreductase [Candidatus Acidoferrales bacterium]|nr:Gfo/Idh/MocA family oxidoreductase [Candidatus Acidoferrales bacterium]
MSESSRRTFLAAGAAAISLRRVLGANGRINVGIVGIGGRGNDHIKTYAPLPDARIVALCDVNQPALERGQAAVLKLTGETPKGYDDMRKMFADKDVDAVSITTPNHWHALSTIWACQAGKDVYCEKPACYNLHEGERMIEVARQTGRMVQIGSQGRSIPHKRKAVELLRDGAIGQVYMAKGLCFKRRKSIGHKPDEPVPPGLNWDMFLGPAPMRPYNELRFRYNWHWFWDTGNGDIGNQGVHEMDYARWGLGEVTWPKSVVSTGGKYLYSDDQETPNTQLATFDYGDKQLVFEVRGLITGGEGGIPKGGSNYVGNLFYGADGWMEVDSTGFRVYKGEKEDLVMEEKEQKEWDTAPHMENFLSACRSRDYKSLHADVAIGVMSADLCHLANASYRAGKKLALDPAKGRFTGPGAEEGNAFLTRPKYRAPYVV